MKCPTCKEELFEFQSGRDGTFVPIVTQYICLKCAIRIYYDYRDDEVIITKTKINAFEENDV